MKFFFLPFLLTGFSQIKSQTVFTKNYIMSFLSCVAPNCGSPSNHTVQLAESNDGLNWNLVPNFPTYQGSVPDVIIRGNKLYIYTPGQVKRFDKSTGLWDATTQSVSIKDINNVPVNYVDPSAYVDSSGLINLVFLNSTGIMGDPAQCALPPCIRYFDSATEVAGSDGTQFITQSGHRITYTVTSTFGPTDPDVFLNGTKYYIYTSQGTSTNVYSSTGGLHGNYTALTTLPGNNQLTNNAGIPCGMFNSGTSTYFSYGHGNVSGGTEIRAAVHSSFNSQPTYTTIITGTSIGLGSTVSPGSPGICENTFLNSVNEQNSFFLQAFCYPNPITDKIFITCDVKENFTVGLTDLLGRNILSKEYEDSEKNIELPMSELKTGIYFIKFSTVSKKEKQFKIIKE